MSKETPRKPINRVPKTHAELAPYGMFTPLPEGGFKPLVLPPDALPPVGTVMVQEILGDGTARVNVVVGAAPDGTVEATELEHRDAPVPAPFAARPELAQPPRVGMDGMTVDLGGVLARTPDGAPQRRAVLGPAARQLDYSKLPLAYVPGAPDPQAPEDPDPAAWRQFAAARTAALLGTSSAAYKPVSRAEYERYQRTMADQVDTAAADTQRYRFPVYTGDSTPLPTVAVDDLADAQRLTQEASERNARVQQEADALQARIERGEQPDREEVLEWMGRSLESQQTLEELAAELMRAADQDELRAAALRRHRLVDNRTGDDADRQAGLFFMGRDAHEEGVDPEDFFDMIGAWRHIIDDTGLYDTLAGHGYRLDREALDLYVPVVVDGAERLIDPLGVLGDMFLSPLHDRDAEYERHVGRWRTPHCDMIGLVPGDAGAVRMGLLPPGYKDMVPPPPPGEEVATVFRANAYLAACAAYLATPWYIPPQYDYAGHFTQPPARPSDRAQFMLPQRWVMVFHDGIPFGDLASTQEMRQALSGHPGFGAGACVVGAVLHAREDMSIDHRVAWLICAEELDPTDGTGQLGCIARPVAFGEHPAGRLLWNYAELLSSRGTWAAPPPLPPATGKEGGSKSRRRQIKSQAAEEGAWHGVHVLYQAPAPRANPDPEAVRLPVANPRGELAYGHERRGTTRARRVHILDGDGRPVGPTRGPDAVYGVTWEYAPDDQRIKIGPTRVRPDLPPKPQDAPVYALRPEPQGRP